MNLFYKFHNYYFGINKLVKHECDKQTARRLQHATSNVSESQHDTKGGGEREATMGMCNTSNYICMIDSA